MFLKVLLPVEVYTTSSRTSLAPQSAGPAHFQSDRRDPVRRSPPHPLRVHDRRPVQSLDPTPQAVESPLDTPPQLYCCPIDRDSCFLAIFGSSPQRVYCVTLVIFSGSPHRTALTPILATLDFLSEVVEVRRAVPDLPPAHIGRLIHARPAFFPHARSFNFSYEARRTVYIHLY